MKEKSQPNLNANLSFIFLSHWLDCNNLQFYVYDSLYGSIVYCSVCA